MNRTSLVSKAKRTLNKILVLIMFCFGVSAGLAGSDKPNLLVNGDFELGAELPDGWRFIGKDGALPQKQVDESVVYEQENGPVGKRALLLKEGGVRHLYLVGGSLTDWREAGCQRKWESSKLSRFRLTR